MMATVSLTKFNEELNNLYAIQLIIHHQYINETILQYEQINNK